jgi:pimeloyl-ACP methyl ester carboxylesterase
VIQGERDTLISGWQAQRLAEAAACPLVIVPGASHAACYFVAPDPYVARLVDLAKSISSP